MEHQGVKRAFSAWKRAEAKKCRTGIMSVERSNTTKIAGDQNVIPRPIDRKIIQPTNNVIQIPYLLAYNAVLSRTISSEYNWGVSSAETKPCSTPHLTQTRYRGPFPVMNWS